ncbi:RNA-binding protein 42 [Staphylotrichum tortipilum]|uniref:RNA-binding protein 42 n=1 Tax=Staphylotrichum tortipilum TaxID=2831512 RepID=A0AAN6MM35_9PEZI|nr:RNA-binding protein 42 [Staphylotrichum longicolle]
MSYPGPPGVSTPSHPSLPPRPPASKVPGFKPAFSAAPAPAASSAPGYTAPAPSYPGYRPAAPPAGSYGAFPSASNYGNPSGPALGAGRGGYGQPNAYHNSYNAAAQNYGQQQQHHQSYYGAQSAASGYSNPAAIRNPFPAPDHSGGGGPGGDYDPEMAAQIAQWQSAYMPKDPNDPANKATPGAAGSGRVGANTPADTPDAADATNPDPNERKKTVYREGGGKKWQDDSLLEWDPAHLRLFVGNLAGETTDDSLLKAFSRWRSVQKAKVVRDKRSTKSKGFGFVSFSDPEDFFQAAKEMNGKYIQSHPVVVRKAKTEVKPAALKEERGGRGRHGKKSGGGNRSGSGMGAGGEGAGAGQAGGAGGGAYEPHLGPVAGGGITKPGQKTKGGLKLLG